ncbi:LysR substrate-binding domain-containing protein [Tabrizicola sp.]|uniref:LysR family transcriptional regulator n=1 Tax=Tabrizicola sp. TaxID=2005166 RepID=UPI003F2B0297
MPLTSLGHLADLTVFCRVAELGHFGAAADQLSLPPSSVSRAVQRLEARLGVSLLTRTTRRVALTDDGSFFLQQAREALQQIEDAEHIVGGANARVVGRLRIAVPTTYGQIRILPRIPAFEALYPDLSLEIHVTNRMIDVVEEGFDLVIRLGQQPSSALVSRTLETGTIGTFASPSYLDRAPPLDDLLDLDRHRCIGFLYPGSPRRMDWEFVVDGRHERRVTGNGALVVSDPMGMVALALAGGGLIQTGHYVVDEHLRSGRLVEVLTSFVGARRPIIALYPPNRRSSAKLRAFLAFFGKAEPVRIR